MVGRLKKLLSIRQTGWRGIPNALNSLSPLGAQNKDLVAALQLLREFIFADWRFFVFYGNYFLRLGQIVFLAGN